MKRLRSLSSLLAVFVLATALKCPADDAVFYISPGGSDAASGTIDAPFASVEKGLAAIRARRKAGNVAKAALYLRGGRYYLAKTIVIGKDDAGTKETPLLVSAWQNEKPVLVGGMPIVNWQAGDNGTATADLSRLPITNPVWEVYLDDHRLIWARYPNFEPDYPYSGGWAYVDGDPFNMYTNVEGESLYTLVQKAQDVRGWAHPEEGMVCIFPRHNWSNNVNNVVSFDPKTRTIALKQQMRFAARPADRYCVFGMKEELDAPGEWYFDSATKKITLVPPKGETPESLKGRETTVALVDRIVEMNETAHVTLSGLTFTAANLGAVFMSKCDHCALEKSTIHDIGFVGNAVHLVNGTDCRIYGCDIYQTGGIAIAVSGGDLWTLQECGHVVENNYIHHSGVFFKSGGPISIGGVGIRVSRNTVHDIPRGAITFTGAKIVVEYNSLRHMNLESEDAGAIYSNGAGSWINSHGCTIRGNWVRDSIGFGQRKGKYQFYMFTWGIYLDDTSGGVDVYDNIVQRCTIGCVHLHNARDSHIYNNVFIDGGNKQFQLSGWSNDPNGRMMKRHFADMVRNYEKAVKCPEWREMRGMAVHPKDTFLPDGSSMSGDRIFRNIFYYPNQPDTPCFGHHLFNFKYNEIDNNLVWNGGKTPIRTGMTGVGKVLASLTGNIDNLDFGKTNTDRFPAGWRWFQKTLDDAKAEKTGPKTLRIHAAYNPDKPYVKTAVLRNDHTFDLKRGGTYRLRFRYSAENAPGHVNAYVVVDRNGLWLPLGRVEGTPGRSGTAESIFTVPKPGDAKFDERMGTGNFAVHVGYDGKTGYGEIADIALEEILPCSEWEAWQQHGIDVHSVVADPLFVDPEHDNFTLKAESPALKLGFKQIDQKKIGVYNDPRRATFPVVEAEGVREHPEWLRVPEK